MLPGHNANVNIAISGLCLKQDEDARSATHEAGVLAVCIYFLYASENTGTGLEAALFSQSVRLLIVCR
jgi:hypothetical protein